MSKYDILTIFKSDVKGPKSSNQARLAYTQGILLSLGLTLFPKFHSEITFDLTVQLQNLPLYEMKLNLLPFKCTRP